jgi:hypothetical protein
MREFVINNELIFDYYGSLDGEKGHLPLSLISLQAEQLAVLPV